ncbi:beta-galactosidase-like protein [Histomonas meleagridis]|nr:beta-galactosidase-like protein [Histomonas meleagridis]
MVIVPPSEYYTQIAFNATYSFVKNGGKLVFLQGVPLYYNVETEARRKLKINFISSWGYPTIVPPQGILEYSSEVPNELRTFNLSTKVGTRFFNDTLLDKPNDRMIPILYGINETMHFKEPAVLIYDYDSDLKGSVIISSLTFTTNNGNKVGTEREQGIYVPQNYLLASRFGVEKFFNYEFRATETDEDDPESFFGIVHRNLDPKPAYYGLKALTRAKPSGSIDYKNIDYMEEEHLKLIWKRPDGKKTDLHSGYQMMMYTKEI